jgi:HK97 family phage major capsid protein
MSDKPDKLKEIQEHIDKGFETLEEQQEARRKEQDEEIDLLKKRLLQSDAANQELAGKITSQEKWISSVEAKVNTARSHGPGQDGLLAAIPNEYRKHIDIAARAGIADPIDRVAKGLWWHLQYKAAIGLRQRQEKSNDEYLRMADVLERAWGFDPVQKGSLGETVGGGQTVIATPVEAQLYRLILDNTIVRPLATKIVMTSLTHQIPVENSNVSAFIVSEFGTITDALPATAFAQRALTAKVFSGLATVSNQILQDNIIGLQDYLFTAIAEQIGRLEDTGALDGGTPTVQNFSGIAVSPGVNSFACSAGAVSGGSIPTYGELIQQIYTGAQVATRQGGAFFMTPLAFKNVVSLVDTTGQPIFSFSNVPNAIPQFMGGYPVYLVSSLSTQWTLGTTTTNIYYGPPSKILFGDIAGMQFDLDPYSLLDKVQTRVRVLKRTAITVPVGAFFTIMKTVKAT